MNTTKNLTAGIINIAGHNIVVSEIVSFFNAGSNRFKVFFKNGIEKEYNVVENKIPLLEAAIINIIINNKQQQENSYVGMPHFQTPYGNSQFNGNRHYNKPFIGFGQMYNDRYDNGYTNYNPSDVLVSPNVEELKNNIVKNMFMLDVNNNNTSIPSFYELRLANEIIPNWKLKPEYSGFSFNDVINYIYSKVQETIINPRGAL